MQDEKTDELVLGYVDSEVPKSVEEELLAQV